MAFKHSIAVIAGISFFINTAGAATVIVQAAAGHPHLGSGAAAWTGEFTDTKILITDGRTISLTGSLSEALVRNWDVPIPITGTNKNWSMTAFADATFFSDFNHRICTFTSSGGFSSCGATVGVDSTSTAFVPLDGSTYDQATLIRNCQQGACFSPTFYHVKATD
jgi:hypothetical protein